MILARKKRRERSGLMIGIDDRGLDKMVTPSGWAVKKRREKEKEERATRKRKA